MKIRIGSKYYDTEVHEFENKARIDIVDENDRDIFYIYMNEEDRRLEVSCASACKIGDEIYSGQLKIIPRASNSVYITLTKYEENS